jgi:hypothetical protein
MLTLIDLADQVAVAITGAMIVRHRKPRQVRKLGKQALAHAQVMHQTAALHSKAVGVAICKIVIAHQTAAVRNKVIEEAICKTAIARSGVLILEPAPIVTLPVAPPACLRRIRAAEDLAAGCQVAEDLVAGCQVAEDLAAAEDDARRT